MEPWGFEPQIPPCHGGVIPFHYGPRDRAHPAIPAAGDQTMKFIPAPHTVNVPLLMNLDAVVRAVHAREYEPVVPFDHLQCIRVVAGANLCLSTAF